MSFPKIELHIHLEGTVRPAALFRFARQVVVDYAAEAASHGATYLEGIFSPSEPARRGVALADHPLPKLLAAGVRCSINTDDPAMFGTDLGSECATALRLGASARELYAAGVAGALCDEVTRAELRRIGAQFDRAKVADESDDTTAASGLRENGAGTQ